MLFLRTVRERGGGLAPASINFIQFNPVPLDKLLGQECWWTTRGEL